MIINRNLSVQIIVVTIVICLLYFVNENYHSFNFIKSNEEHHPLTATKINDEFLTTRKVNEEVVATSKFREEILLTVAPYDKLREKLLVSALDKLHDLPFLIKGKLRKLERKMNEMANKNSTKMHKISQQFENVKSELLEISNAIVIDVAELSHRDSDANNYRNEELIKISAKIQKNIRKNQFPNDCKKAKKMDCSINRHICAYACQIQHYINCLIYAYGTNRVLLPIDFDKWLYTKKSWTEFFLPITNCTEADIQNSRQILNINGSNESLEMLHVTSLKDVSSLRPPAFPKEFVDLLHLHSNPPLFWISQFAKFIKFKPHIDQLLEEKENAINFSSPIIGIHVRGTDKVKQESYPFTLEQYMEHARDWYDLQILKYPNETLRKRILLITDEPEIINESLAKYPEYEFFFDIDRVISARTVRYNEFGLLSVMIDIHLLSKCDYIICTLSSNMCRLAYEYAIEDFVKNGDFTRNIVSLDKIYMFWGQQDRQQVAVYDHSPDLENGEIELQIGDVLSVSLPTDRRKNRLDGFINGTNLRTGKMGFYPLFKVEEKWLITAFPKYD